MSYKVHENCVKDNKQPLTNEQPLNSKINVGSI